MNSAVLAIGRLATNVSLWPPIRVMALHLQMCFSKNNWPLARRIEVQRHENEEHFAMIARRIFFIATIFPSLLIAWGVRPWTTIAAEESDATQAAARVTVNDNVGQEVGPTMPAHVVLGQTVVDRQGRFVGVVTDAIVDPYTGMAATFLVQPKEPLENNAQLLLPFVAFAPIEAGQLRLRDIPQSQLVDGPTIAPDELNLPYTRELAAVPFEYYGMKPYWKMLSKKAEHSAASDNEKSLYVNQPSAKDHDLVRLPHPTT